MAKGKLIKVEIQPYHILDVMADQAYIPHFLRRFHIQMEEEIGKGKDRHPWSYVYEDKPKLLYDDAIDEIKRILGLQKSSASLFKFGGAMQKIVLAACSDWITEKTGRLPEFEIFPNTVKSARINFDYYGRGIAHQKRKAEWEKAHPGQSSNPALNMGDTGASDLRDELE